MKEGDYIIFNKDNVEKTGRIIKIYTQIGFSDHGKTFAIIQIDGRRGLFNKNTLKIEMNELQNIARLH